MSDFHARVAWFEQHRGLTLAEATNAARRYDPSLHPKDRLGRWQKKLGSKLTFDPSKSNEASNVNGRIVVGPKFLALTDKQQENVMAHELGHDMDEAMLKDKAADWVWVQGSWQDDKGVVMNGPQTSPHERIADAYASALTGDTESAKRWPAILHVAAYARAMGNPIHPKIEAMLASKPKLPSAPLRADQQFKVFRQDKPKPGAFSPAEASALPTDPLDAYAAILKDPRLRWTPESEPVFKDGRLVVGTSFWEASPKQRRAMIAKLTS